jgi:hypothetical protein
VNIHTKLAADVKIAAVAIDLIKQSVDESDPDFAQLVEQECDALERVRRILWSARSAEADAEALGTMINEMAERKARFIAKKDGLRQAARWAMEEMGLAGWKWPEFTVSLRPGKPSLKGEADPGTLPIDLVKIKREPDKTAIAAALAEGREVPGFYLSNAQSVLTVRCK